MCGYGLCSSAAVAGGSDQFAPQHFLYFLPDPHRQDSLRPVLLLPGMIDLAEAVESRATRQACRSLIQDGIRSGSSLLLPRETPVAVFPLRGPLGEHVFEAPVAVGSLPLPYFELSFSRPGQS
jgi:hypothetical protein